LFKEVKVDHFIKEMTHKLNVLTFWVKLWCPAHLYCGSESNVGEWWSPGLSSWPNSGIVVRRRVQGWAWPKVLD